MDTVTAVPSQAHADRINIYTVVHKGLRGFMADTLVRVGRMDVEDPCEMAEALGQLRNLLKFCRSHIEHEDRFLHPALEKVRTGASVSTAHDHHEHLDAIRALEQEIAYLEQGTDSARPRRANRLYFNLSRFVAENFEHMSVEETDNHQVLAAGYTDAEILALDAAIVASIPPQELAVWLRWMISHSSAAERASLVGGVKAGAPREVFEFVMGIAREVLSERDRYKLELAVG